MEMYMLSEFQQLSADGLSGFMRVLYVPITTLVPDMFNTEHKLIRFNKQRDLLFFTGNAIRFRYLSLGATMTIIATCQTIKYSLTVFFFSLFYT